MLRKEEDARNEAIWAAAQEIMLAVRTAPKTRGRDNIAILIADQEHKEQLAGKMDEINERSGGKRVTFSRDAKGLRLAQAALLIGVRVPDYGLNCGWCGFESCEVRARQRPGTPCVFPVIDLGIASGVAAARLADKFIDNRMMFSMGYAALQLDWFDKDVTMALGFPLSASGKNPYFDRG